MSSFLSSIQQALTAASVRADGHVLLVALSGGADSVALLLALRELGFPVEALHCNFELRGVASDADEAFCRRLCKAHQVELFVKHFRTRSFSQRHGISIEMAARQLRYEWFSEMAVERGAQALCVAHHRDDQIETLLLNLIRGTGIHGLTGMKVVSQYQPMQSSTAPLQVLRPMLGLSRLEIEEWLRERGQDWVTDHTNLDPEAAMRNKIRLQLLPLMEELNPCVRETLAATAERLAEAEALYNDGVQQARADIEQPDGSLSLQALKQVTAAGTVLHETLHPLGFTTEQVREIHENLDGESGKLWESRQGHRLLRDRDRLLVRQQTDEEPTSPLSREGSFIPLEGFYEGAHGLRLLIRRQTIDPLTFEIPKDPSTACFDLEKLTLPLSIRVVRDGDRFRPFGMTGSRLLSDFLTDRKLSLFDKEQQQVILSGDQIVWVIGLRCAAGYEIDEHTRHILTLTML